MDYDCETSATNEYFVRLQTVTGALIVYSIFGTGGLKTEIHIGYFVEDRGIMLQSIIFASLPFVFYFIAIIRVNSRDVLDAG